MPLYDFKDTKTGETFEKFMSISTKEDYLKDNPHIQQVILSTANNSLIPPDRLDASRRKDGGFKEVLQKIHQRTPGSTLNKTSNI